MSAQEHKAGFEQQVLDALRAAPAPAPSAELDARIRARAHTAVARHHGGGRSGPRWLSLAAGLVVLVGSGFALRLWQHVERQPDPLAEPMARPQAAAVAEGMADGEHLGARAEHKEAAPEAPGASTAPALEEATVGQDRAPDTRQHVAAPRPERASAAPPAVSPQAFPGSAQAEALRSVPSAAAAPSSGAAQTQPQPVPPPAPPAPPPATASPPPAPLAPPAPAAVASDRDSPATPAAPRPAPSIRSEALARPSMAPADSGSGPAPAQIRRSLADTDAGAGAAMKSAEARGDPEAQVFAQPELDSTPVERARQAAADDAEDVALAAIRTLIARQEIGLARAALQGWIDRHPEQALPEDLATWWERMGAEEGDD